MKTLSRKSMVLSEEGIVTIDFIFAFMLMLGFGALMFSLALTLTMVEVTQYVTFAAARNFYGAHIIPPAQETLALQKYAELTNQSALKALYSNGWFSIKNPPDVGDLSLKFSDYQSADSRDPNLFWGVGTSFVARMLDYQIPIYGSTTNEGDGSGDGFGTYIASYLGREVTTNECINFSRQRWIAIRGLTVSGAVGYSFATSEDGYVTFTDNGC